MTTRLHHVENADETVQDWWYSGTAGMMVQHVIWRSGSAHVQIKANREKAGDAQWLSSLPSLPFTLCLQGAFFWNRGAAWWSPDRGAVSVAPSPAGCNALPGVSLDQRPP